MADYTPSEKYLKHKAKRAEQEARRQANSKQSSEASGHAGAMSQDFRDVPGSRRLTEQEFESAIQLAKEYGVNIDKSRPDPAVSGLEGEDVVLRDGNGAIVRKLPARLLPALGDVPRDSKNRAIAWARSMGFTVPTKPDGCLSAIIIGLGFLIFVVPGILACIWVWMMNDSYEKKVSSIIAMWIEAGRPEPGVQKNLEEKLANAEKQASTTEQLTEYRALLDKGLVTDEEYQELRRKALGLNQE